MERLQLPLPIWRVQYQLLGGHRRMVAICVAVTAILGIAFIAIGRVLSDMPKTVYVDGWITFLAVLQPVILVLAGCNAVYRAILRDFNTHMLESHRLTPLSNVTFIAGFVGGATLQTLALSLIVMLFGSALLIFDEQTVRHWMIGHVLLLSGAVMLWCATAFLSLQGAKPRAPGGYLVAIGMLSSVIYFLPGAGVALGSYSVLGSFGVLTGNAQLASAAVAGMVAINLILASFWFFAAAAKFRRPDMAAFHALRGVVFFLLWLFISVGTLVAVGVAGPLAQGLRLDVDPYVQGITALASSLLISIFPITGAVRCYRSVQQGARSRGWFDRVRPYKVVLVCAIWLVAIAATFFGGLPAAVARSGGTPLGDAFGLVAREILIVSLLPTCVLAMFTVMVVYDLALRIVRSPLLITLVVMIALWALPCVLDSIRATAVADFSDDVTYSWLMGCSPAGTIIALGMQVNIALLPGFFAQALILLVATILSRVLGRKPKPIHR